MTNGEAIEHAEAIVNALADKKIGPVEGAQILCAALAVSYFRTKDPPVSKEKFATNVAKTLMWVFDNVEAIDPNADTN